MRDYSDEELINGMGYSRRMSYGHEPSMDYVRPDGSYRDGGSYARGRRGNVARDSMGRYSSANDQTVQDVRMLLNRTQDENARQELSKLLDKLENM